MADVREILVQYGNNFVRNLANMFTGMDAIRWIRLVAVVGAYLFIRPYLEKGAAHFGKKHREKEPDAYDKTKSKAKLSPNNLRGTSGKTVTFEDSASEEEEEASAATTGASWGKKARKRQRQLEKQVEEEEERLRLEKDGDEDDKDIMEYLVDYEEGKDGW